MNNKVIPRNDLFLRAARREPTERTPVWLMRQAGRTDPAYNKIRKQSTLSLRDTFRNSELATEISLLPKRIGVDAIIMFQDILTPLSPMGLTFDFDQGPVLDQPIRSEAQIEALRLFDPADELAFVGRTLQQLKGQVGDELPVLGFAGAPLTLALFMIEGTSPGASARHWRSIMKNQSQSMHSLLDKLATMTVSYLNYQIEMGASAVQLFESLADYLTAEEYRQFAHPYHVKIFSELSSEVPRILFAREQPDVSLLVQSGADVLSIGKCVDLADARRQYGDQVAFQGNVDNRILVDGSSETIERAVQDCIAAGGHTGHILNLNHGLLRHTPFEHVQKFIQFAKDVQVGSPA